MFDIGATELLVVAMITILVVGPKDLPGVLRNFAQFFGKARRMANDFQGQFNQALREAERQSGLEETKRQVRDATKVDVPSHIGIKTAPGSTVPNGDAAKAASQVTKLNDTPSDAEPAPASAVATETANAPQSAVETEPRTGTTS